MDAKANAKLSDVPVGRPDSFVVIHASVEIIISTGCTRHPLKTMKLMTVTRMMIVTSFLTATDLVLHGKVSETALPVFLVLICCSPHVR